MYNGLQYDENEMNEKFKPEEMNNNCYTYAINQSLNPFMKEPYNEYADCQPGRLGNHYENRMYINTDFSNLIECARKDLNLIGYELIESTYAEYINDSEAWKIAAAITDPDSFHSDYHWYRQNSDGTWSHKPGLTHIRNIDEDNRIIYNPETCNRGKYTRFLGFYIIIPIESYNKYNWDNHAVA